MICQNLRKSSFGSTRASHALLSSLLQYAGADLAPEPQLFRRSEQDGRQGHGQHLVGDPVDFAQRRDDSFSHSGQPVRASRTVRRLQPLVDPADQIAIGDVANEEVERIGELVQVAVTQVMGRQRTARNMID